MREIIRRIERAAGVPDLGKILAEQIEPTDLQSLLLEVYRERVKHRSPRVIFSDYASNSFTLPSRCNPKLLLEWDRVVKHLLIAVFEPFGECLLFDSFGVCLGKRHPFRYL